MTRADLEHRLADLIAFQCTLVALRGVSVEASEEMIWQTLLGSLEDQYGFRRVWYGHGVEGRIRPSVSTATRAGLEDLPREIGEDSPILRDADLLLPIAVDGGVEGWLVVQAESALSPERSEQIRILATEASTILTERRSRRRNEEALRQAKEKLEKTVEELNESHWHLRKIQETLPICMYCGKVKTGDSRWEGVVEYLKANSLFLSHGCCPACLPRMLGGSK